MKLKGIANTVKRILINQPETKEDDNLLILKVWAIQNPSLRTDKNFTFWDFSKEFLKKKFASTESIRRSRCKLQEEFPGLRGKNYGKRKSHQESVKEELKSPEINVGGTP